MVFSALWLSLTAPITTETTSVKSQTGCIWKQTKVKMQMNVHLASRQNYALNSFLILVSMCGNRSDFGHVHYTLTAEWANSILLFWSCVGSLPINVLSA